jgi:arabinofuranan 3-O-arabinosyltransferase
VARRLRDTAAWTGLAVLASVWWLGPLLYLGSYAPPFLDFIESADNTAGATGWLSSLRGTSHWVAFFPEGGRVGWVGGYQLASSEWLLVPTVLVAAGGLAGLLLRGLWQRRALAVALLVGLAVLTAGSGGWAGSVFSEAWLQALDTSLSPLRNIHKIDPVVRLPLSLGLGALVTLAPRRLPRQRWMGRWGSPGGRRKATLVLMSGLICAALVPALTGSLRTDGGFSDISGSWRDAVAFLDEQREPVRVMVLPGAGFAVQTWGRTVDEPIQVLDPPAWMSRAQATVAPAGTLRVLADVESAVSEGRPQPRLAEALRRLGVTHIVVRNDLDPTETDAPSRDLVEATLEGLPGAERVASFGRARGGGPAIVVHELGQDDDPRVDLLDWEDRAVVSGGPEAVPDLAASGVVGPDEAVVLDSEAPSSGVVTDSFRRVERSFGRVHDATSGVMTEGDDFRVDRLVHDFVGGGLPESRTTAVYRGASAITASSSTGYADVLGPVRPEEHPYAAFDQSIYTAWASDPLSRPEGQWIEVRFDEPVAAEQVRLTFDTFTGAEVTSVRLATEDRSMVADVPPNGTVTAAELDDPSARLLRVTVLAAVGDRRQVRLSDVRIAGHDVERRLALPGEVSESGSVLLSAEAPRRACQVTARRRVSCDLARQRETSETPGFARELTFAEAGEWRFSGAAVATHGPALEQLYAPLARAQVLVEATSTYAGDPAVGPALALDNNVATGWTSAPGDPAPALQLSWGPERRVSSVRVLTRPRQPGRPPPGLWVDAGPGTGPPQLVATTGPDAGSMRPVRTDQLRLTSTEAAPLEGVGISEVDIGGVAPLRNRTILNSVTGTQCGFGPRVEVAGQVVETRLTGTLREVRDGTALDVVPCRAGVPVSSGQHVLRVTNPPGFAVTELALVPADTVAADMQPGTAQVRSWTPSRREVVVDSGAASALTINESFNRGWAAHLGGRSLTAVTIDGWRQGFVVPAGASGVVTLEYTAQSGFSAVLVGGLVIAGLLVLLALALLVGVRRGRWAPDAPTEAGPVGATASGRGRTAVQVAAVLLLGVVSLPLAGGAVVGWATRAQQGWRVALATGGGLLVAALVTLSANQSVVAPPPGADVITALVVGVVCGRVLASPGRSASSAQATG